MARSVTLNGLVRHQFAVIALAGIALISSFWLLLDLIGVYPQNVQAFGVAAFESRFDALRPTVTIRSVFGYSSDNPPNDPSAVDEFYLTQYTLAPAIVRASIDEHLVVVNTHNAKPDLQMLGARSLTLLQNFGNGVLLCRNDNR